MSACSESETHPQIITYIPVATAQALGQLSASSSSQPSITVANSPENNQLVAVRVNGQPILLEAYKKQVARFEQALLEKQNHPNGQIEQTQLTEIRRQVLEMLIEQVLLEQEAQRLQVIITKEELQAKTNETMAAGGSDQFEAWLATNHFTRLEFAETLRAELVAKRVFEQLTQTISDNTAKQQFFQEWLARQKSSARIERYVAL
ncbi:MAG: SurA N-terminal domain-containing protein [Anaerolineae bacterium]